MNRGRNTSAAWRGEAHWNREMAEVKKRRFYIIELGLEDKNLELDANRSFKINFQKSILLSLLEKKQIDQWQFERCIEELEKQ